MGELELNVCIHKAAFLRCACQKTINYGPHATYICDASTFPGHTKINFMSHMGWDASLVSKEIDFAQGGENSPLMIKKKHTVALFISEQISKTITAIHYELEIFLVRISLFTLNWAIK